MIYISMGWGVQSWTLAAMSALRELPPVDAAIHADTMSERQETYRFAQEWTPWLETHGVRVVTVSDPQQTQKVTTHQTNIPAFTVGGKTNRGQLRRQCTNHWKIIPMRRWISAELKRLDIRKSPDIVEQWLGITEDEWKRAKDSDVQYIKYKFPLLDMGFTRLACVEWLQKNNLPVPVKSSCTFCPYHGRAAWNEMKRAGGADWEQAVDMDNQIRNVRPPHALFIHSSRIPLIDAVNIPEDAGLSQLSMIYDDECDSGYCFL